MLGGAADDAFARESLARREVLVTPAAPAFADTYAIRVERFSPGARPLLGLQGTALAIGLHAVLMGALGLLCVDAAMRRRAVAPPARAFALLALGLATLWGPYSTVLFSHVSSGTFLVAMALALERATDADARARALDLAAGLCGGWAVASDYMLLLVVVPWVALHAAPRRWPLVALGALPLVLATAAYHDAAFGSPLAIGYDFHASFDFARSRGSTFDGNPLVGAWTLLGLGHGAGVLALAPVVLVGAAALASGRERRWLAAILPWLVSLSLHRTPWGGATEDHRYLVPILPWMGVGLGIAWQRLHDRGGSRAHAGRIVLAALALGSAFAVWTHFFGWRNG
jgi:hypothetical protein